MFQDFFGELFKKGVEVMVFVVFVLFLVARTSKLIVSYIFIIFPLSPPVHVFLLLGVDLSLFAG